MIPSGIPSRAYDLLAGEDASDTLHYMGLFFRQQIIVSPQLLALPALLHLLLLLMTGPHADSLE